MCSVVATPTDWLTGRAFCLLLFLTPSSQVNLFPLPNSPFISSCLFTTYNTSSLFLEERERKYDCFAAFFSPTIIACVHAQPPYSDPIPPPPLSDGFLSELVIPKGLFRLPPSRRKEKHASGSLPPGQSGSKVRRTAATLLSPLDLSSDKEKDKEDQQNYSVERYLLQLE